MSETATDSNTGPPRKAVGVDPDIKQGNLARLRRIEGQVRGIQRMVEEDRYCPDILSQVTAAQRALQAVSRELVRNHLRHCVASAVRTGGTAEEEAYEEIVELFRRSGG